MEPSTGTTVRELIRGLPVLRGCAPEFDPDAAPENPVELFVAWFEHAVYAGVTEPHAMTVSTTDPQGRPNARVLILKDVDESGWHFAVSAVSRKGSDITANPVAALTFYWPELARQVRVSGPVVADGPEVSAQDFLARSVGSRATAMTRRQSQPLVDENELTAALEKAHHEIERDPQIVPDEWISYAVRADRVEFWQGDAGRRHRRLCYEADGESWCRTRLWP